MYFFKQVTENGAGLNFSSNSSMNFGCYSGKSNFQVFVAKYNYDPLVYSPNENPEAELTLNAGDYVIVYGGMDEVGIGTFPLLTISNVRFKLQDSSYLFLIYFQDGFFDGELKDGRRGLIPSNFVEKLQGKKSQRLVKI